jgi:hypothetical protein
MFPCELSVYVRGIYPRSAGRYILLAVYDSANNLVAQGYSRMQIDAQSDGWKAISGRNSSLPTHAI